jgi:SPP1 family predicted phage head-tail adaptor
MSASIGSMRVSASLETPVESLDDAGTIIRSYAQLAKIWAQIIPLRGEGRFLEGRQEQAITHIARFRWRDGVASQMRLSFRNRTLLIHSVYDEDERRRFLKCHCEEIGS